jgi:hypothetical protein
MRSTDKYVFFWRGTFSQWHRSYFAIDGVAYNAAEQYMMAGKARLFNDLDTLEKIMKTKNVRTQKHLGREVKNFDPAIWTDNCLDIVVAGNYAKFTQNEEMKQELLATGDKTLVEASPYDKIWGIGMAEDHPDVLDESKWKGTNLLGKALMIVRDKIRAEGI